MFALILNESLDISRHEQAAVVLRYANPHFVVNERLLAFFMLLKQMVSHSTVWSQISEVANFPDCSRFSWKQNFRDNNSMNEP